MQDLAELVEWVASAVHAIDVTDLPALADLHARLQEMAALSAVAADGAVREAAASARRLVEMIVLAEVDDSQAALRAVADAVGRVRAGLADSLQKQSAARLQCSSDRVSDDRASGPLRLQVAPGRFHTLNNMIGELVIAPSMLAAGLGPTDAR